MKPGRLGKAAREKAGLDRKGGHRKPASEEKDAPHALADEVYEEVAGAVGRGIPGHEGGKGKSLAFALSGHWVESWVAPPDALEEVLQAENDGVMDCEEEMFTDLAEAIIPVGDRTWCPEEAARNAKLALEAAEMAAAEAESYLMELDMLLKKDLGV